MIGKTISHYQILEEIGRGGMGEVCLARDLDLERQVAIKFLPKDLTRDDDNVERFKREARAAATLNHPNIITIYEIGVSDGEYFIVMEYVKGETLRDKLDRDNQLSFTDINTIMEQLCQGLDKAHQAGIVHRDIKPENIFVNEDGRVKILDFGLAKLRGSRKLTKDFSTLGTIKYISPEQARGEETSAQSDIWSTGIILYEMLTGEVPFKGDYEQAVIYGILNENPQPPDKLRADSPSGLNRIIDQSLQKDPEKRYQSISRLASELNTVQSVKKADIEHRKPVKSSPLKYLYWSIAFIVVLVTAIVFFLSSMDENLDQLMIQVAPLIEKGDYDAAYDHFVNSGIGIADIIDTELFDRVAGYITIDSNPQNARISLARVRYTPSLHQDIEILLGVTPVVNQALIVGEYHLTLSLSETESIGFIIEVTPKDSLMIFRSISPAGFSEEGMVLIDAGKTFEGESVPTFYIDIHEVTNKEFFAFMSAGGYRLSHLWPVGYFPLGISPFGCFDMAGNVNEWLRDSNGLENPARTAGGSWQTPSYMFEPIHAQPFRRDYSSTDIGFRCVKPIKKK